MADRKSTRLRHIVAKSPEELESAVESLPFKVEIKGNPVFDRENWYVFFTIADSVPDDFGSVDLT